MKLDLEKYSRNLLILLILVDAVFMGLHIVHIHTGYLSSYNFSLAKDMGYSEIYQYMKEFWLAVLLLILAFRKGSPVFAAWALLFAVFLIDDAFRFHERLGYDLADFLSLQSHFGLRAQDVGEFLVVAVAGAVLLPFIGATHLLSSHADIKTSWKIVFLVGVLLFFGVAVDMAQMACVPETGLYKGLGLMEDGGEMVVMSVILWYVYQRHALMGAAEAPTLPWGQGRTRAGQAQERRRTLGLGQRTDPRDRISV